MTDSIFGDNTQTNDAVPNPQASAPADHPLVGPGKKYATLDKALEALTASQQHIATIEAENRDLRVKADGTVSVEQVHATVQELLAQERATHKPAVVDEATLGGLLDRKLAETRAQETRKSNQSAVATALKDKYGDKAEEVFTRKAEELGLSVATLNEIAATSPKAALEYFGNPKAPAGLIHSSGSINTSAFNTNVQLPDKPKSPMSGGTTKDISASWEYAKAKVLSGQGGQ